MKNLLSIEDFQDTKIGSNWNRFDCLVEVARVALLKEQKPVWGFKYFKSLIVFKEEEVGLTLKQDKNKRKRQSKEEDEEWEEPKLKRNKKICPKSYQPPLLPESLKKLITEKGGTDLSFVIQKPLFQSDINTQLSRFSIPLSETQFLTQTEEEDVDAKKSIEVGLIEPSMKESWVSFEEVEDGEKLHLCSDYIVEFGCGEEWTQS